MNLSPFLVQKLGVLRNDLPRTASVRFRHFLIHAPNRLRDAFTW